jgi:transcriptional regulator with XRE-family HTH domain
MIDKSFIRKKIVSENIRKRLKALGMQQNELAEKIGMAPQQLSFYVLGKREPREKTLKKIAEGLELKSPLELYIMSSEFLGENLAEAWNCMIEVAKLTDKTALVIRFLKLILHTHKENTKPELIKAIEHLIAMEEK